MKIRTRSKLLIALVADAVVIEPVSAPKFPANREKSREFRKISTLGALKTATNDVFAAVLMPFPYSTEQGINLVEQGNLDCTPGVEQGLGCWIDSLVGVLILELV